MSSSTFLLSAAGASGDSGWLTLFQNGTNKSADNLVIETATNGDIYVAGNHTVFGSYLNKIDKVTGDVTQSATYGSEEYIRKIFIDSSENIYLISWRVGSNNGNRSRFYKFNSSFTFQFCKEYYSTTSSVPTIPYGGTFDGTNFYVCGYKDSAVNGFYLKYDTSGNLLYDYAASAGTPQILNDVVDSGTLQYYIGDALGLSPPTAMMFYVNDNESASGQTGYTVTDGTTHSFNRITSKSGSFYISGYYKKSPLSSQRVFVAKMSGVNVTWATQFEMVARNNGADASPVAVDNLGNVYTSFNDDPSGSAQQTAYLGKLDSSGNLVWVRKLYLNVTLAYAHAIITGITFDANNNPIISGYVNKYYDSNYAANFVAKLPKDGSGTGVYGTITYAEHATTAATCSLVTAGQNYGVQDFGGHTTLTPTETVTSITPVAETTYIL